MAIKSILLIATPFFSYHSSVKFAFEQNGVTCDTLVYNRPKKLLSFFFRKTKHGYNLLLKKQKTKFLLYIYKNYGNYDAILIFGAYLFSKDELALIKKNTGLPVIFWLLDSLYNFPESENILQNIDLYFCYNEEDVLTLSRMGKSAFFLPLAFDSRFYKNLSKSEKLYDIYFIGSLKNRITFLNEYIKRIDHFNLRIRIDGKVSLFYRARTKKKYSYFYKHYTGKTINHQDINVLYNSSKICLNIQPKQATSGLAIRTYEIFGSGAIQFTNGNRAVLEKLFKNEEKIVYYKDINHLVQLTKDIFKNNTTNMPNSNFDNQNKSRHNFINRINQVLKEANVILN